jgi:acyl carrier protein
MASPDQDRLEMFRELLVETGHVLEAERLSADTTPKQLGIDSLTLLELLMLVDERTGIEITTDEVGLDTSFSELASLIDRKSA